MANSYFRFKQFTVYQDKCAMKVCTDACLFGAWAADRLQFTAHRVLDIGTGTGLLSLMLAQKNPDAIIDAVEIDEAAAQQAQENFNASPWKERLKVYNNSIQQFAETASHKYDVIISNPPFYENDLKSDNAKKNLALHSSELKLEELIAVADKLLNEDGSFFVLLPYYRSEEFEAMIEGNFFVRENVLVKQSEKHGWFRGMWWLVRNKFESEVSGIVITDGTGNYKKDFAEFLNDYYLYL